MANKTNDALIKLKKQIKEGKLAPLYLFYGDEEFLRDMYVSRIIDSVPDGGFPEFNRLRLEGDDIPYSEYDDAWESFPMMAEKKIIHIKNSGIFTIKKSENSEVTSDERKKFWSEKFKRISDDTIVIFDEASIDKRSALYKAVNKAGVVVEFAHQSEADLVTWVIKQCLNAKKKISKDNAYYLISICDPGMNSIQSELQKLFDYCDGDISRSDIDRVVSKSVQVVIFELTNSIMSGNTNRAMSTLSGLKTNKESAFPVMYLMLSTFEKILRTKTLRGSSQKEIAAALGVGYKVAGQYIESAEGFSAKSLIWMIRRVAELDLAIKEGRAEEFGALEQYVMECIYASMADKQQISDKSYKYN